MASAAPMKTVDDWPAANATSGKPGFPIPRQSPGKRSACPTTAADPPGEDSLGRAGDWRLFDHLSFRGSNRRLRRSPGYGLPEAALFGFVERSVEEDRTISWSF